MSQAPREFKLHFDCPANDCKVEIASDKAYIQNYEVIRVIEKSAYDSLKAELDSARRGYEFELHDKQVDIDSLKAELDALKSALTLEQQAHVDTASRMRRENDELKAENEKLKKIVLEHQDGKTCDCCGEMSEAKIEPYTEAGITIEAELRVCKNCGMQWFSGRQLSIIDRKIRDELKKQVESLTERIEIMRGSPGDYAELVLQNKALEAEVERLIKEAQDLTAMFCKAADERDALKSEVESLKEYKWKYEELCK